MTEAPTGKRFRAGTHRVCSPEETLARVWPLLGHFGITRVADLTRLDRIGIPTFQAVRPASRSLSVSQGKGLSPAAAKVSAVMEGIECWHAERLGPPDRVARVREVAPELGYDVFELCHLRGSLLNRGTRLEWLRARRMDGSGDSLVPSEYLSLDTRVGRRWAAPVLVGTSNGLASGNTVGEAALHALAEVLERDGTARLRATPRQRRRAVAADSVRSSAPRELIERMRAARVNVQILDATGPSRVPCFEAVIAAEDHPVAFLGSGCHLDADVALCRALTEAAQSRLTEISGARDDITVRRRTAGAGADPGQLAGELIGYEEISSIATDDIAEDLALLVTRVAEQAGSAPLIVDLTRPELGIPVVRVVAPGLLHLLADPLEAPGAEAEW